MNEFLYVRARSHAAPSAYPRRREICPPSMCPSRHHALQARSLFGLHGMARCSVLLSVASSCVSELAETHRRLTVLLPKLLVASSSPSVLQLVIGTCSSLLFLFHLKRLLHIFICCYSWVNQSFIVSVCSALPITYPWQVAISVNSQPLRLTANQVLLSNLSPPALKTKSLPSESTCNSDFFGIQLTKENFVGFCFFLRICNTPLLL